MGIGGLLWPTGWQRSEPSSSLGCNTAVVGWRENADRALTTGSNARPSCFKRTSEPFVRNTLDSKMPPSHHYHFSTAYEALAASFWISFSSRTLSLSIRCSRPAARVCRSHPGSFICVLKSKFLWGVFFQSSPRGFVPTW